MRQWPQARVTLRDIWLLRVQHTGRLTSCVYCMTLACVGRLVDTWTRNSVMDSLTSLVANSLPEQRENPLLVTNRRSKIEDRSCMVADRTGTVRGSKVHSEIIRHLQQGPCRAAGFTLKLSSIYNRDCAGQQGSQWNYPAFTTGTVCGSRVHS